MSNKMDAFFNKMNKRLVVFSIDFFTTSITIFSCEMVIAVFTGKHM